MDLRNNPSTSIRSDIVEKSVPIGGFEIETPELSKRSRSNISIFTSPLLISFFSIISIQLECN